MRELSDEALRDAVGRWVAAREGERAASEALSVHEHAVLRKEEKAGDAFKAARVAYAKAKRRLASARRALDVAHRFGPRPSVMRSLVGLYLGTRERSQIADTHDLDGQGIGPSGKRPTADAERTYRHEVVRRAFGEESLAEAALVAAWKAGERST